MKDKFTGVSVLEDFNEIQKFYENGFIDLSTLKLKSDLYPNQFLVLKSAGQTSALAKISNDGKKIVPIKQNWDFFGVIPKNKEQIMLFNVLADESLKVVTVTGKAGTGKSLLIGSYLCDALTKKKIDKIVISKPMEIVGGSKYYGTVPGDSDEKFAPFLLNFKYLFDKLAGDKGKSYFDMFLTKGLIEFMPLELMRGVSFSGNTVVYLDEAQNVDDHIIKTLGTRIGEESRLIISGDYNQVDVKTKGFKPGIMKVIESEIFKQSPITGHIHLLKVERGPVAELFTKIFEEE
jgi:PhoH-like ATPase